MTSIGSNGPRYSLAPSFDCPFGWPARPTYPIDLDLQFDQPSEKTLVSSNDPSINRTLSVSSSPIHTLKTKSSSLHQNLLEIFQPNQDESRSEIDSLNYKLNRLYLQTLYLPELRSVKSQESAVEKFAKHLRSYQDEHDQDELIELYKFFLIPEELLARKWGEEMRKIARTYEPAKGVEDSTKEQPEPEDPEIENEEDIFHLNEPEVFVAVLQHIFSDRTISVQAQSTTDRPVLDSSSKVSFIKPGSIAQQLEVWGNKETELQILLLLEIIILTNMSLDSESQLFHTRQSSSPKKRRPKHLQFKLEQEEVLDCKEVLADLESALEGLIDRLAMWQTIGLGNQLSSSLRLSNPDSSHISGLQDLDDVQRFWTDAVEEHYTQYLPLLNPSFRPKLFPTSIYDPSASSSLLPTQFDSTAKPKHDLFSSVHRTPNLKKLEQRALRKANRVESQAKLNLSPTLMELTTGLKRKSISRANSTRESQTGSKPTLSVNSRSLFKRREIQMSSVPAKTKPTISRVSSLGAKQGQASSTNVRSLFQSETRGLKRKQSSPKRNQTNHTELLATPRKSLKTNDLAHSIILVPDTPQTVPPK